MAFLPAALAAAILLAGPALAARDGPARLCFDAADRAARARGVPAEALRALTLTETGRRRDGRFEPWPWTVNMEGEGRWFDTPAEALAYVERERARGARSFDIGCFQVNHLWHGREFDSVAAMFDPQTNADYAARFLSELYAETGDWTRAAGLYHSRTPKFRDRYAARFARILAARGGIGEAPAPSLPAAAETPAPPREARRVRRMAAVPATPGAVALAATEGVGEGPVGAALFAPARGPLLAPARGRLISPQARDPLIAPAARRLID